MVRNSEPVSFGALLRHYRLARGWTQEELAEHAGLSVQAVSTLERGTRRAPRLTTARDLAEALNLSDAERTGFLAAIHDDQPSTVSPSLPAGGFLGALPTGVLVGRGEESARLSHALDVVQGGEGRLVLLAGEPGVGKTRLAQEVSVAARDRGFLIAAGRCYEPEQTLPYYPFLDVLDACVRAPHVSAHDEIVDRWPYLARLVPQGSHHVEATTSSMTTTDGQADQQRLFREVTGFLRTLTEHTPIALLLDDLHWVDSASLGLLLHLARHTRGLPILLLGTYRDAEITQQHPLEAAIHDLTRDALLERIPVRRLGRQATTQLVAATLDDVQVSDEFGALIYDPTEGNPFFVQQVLRSMVERGDVYREEGRWHRKEFSEISVPESVRSVIGRRVMRLRETTQEVLREASVLGQAFRFDDLWQMGGHEEDVIDAALQEAEAAVLVKREGKDAYRFDHALTQAALLDELTPRRVRRLHTAAARGIERGSDGDRVQRGAELAWHFLQANEPALALPYTLLAGDGAMQLFAHEEAERQYRTAIDLAEELHDLERKAQALEKLGEVLMTTARLNEALESLEEAIAAYHALQDLEGEGRATASLASIHARRGNPNEALERVRSMIGALAPAGPTQSLGQLYLALSWIYTRLGNHDDSMAAGEQAISIAQSIGDDRILARAEAQRTLNLFISGNPADALAAIEAILIRVEVQDDLAFFGGLSGMAAWICLHSGDFVRSKMHRERSLEIARRVGDPSQIAQAVGLLGSAQFLLGEWRDARAHYTEALRLARELGETILSALPLLDLGHLCRCEGDFAAARRYLDASLAIGDPASGFVGTGLTECFLASLDTEEGHPEAAIARLTPFLDRLGALELEVGRILPHLAHAYLELGDIDTAETMANDAVRRTTAQHNRIDLVGALLAQGQVLGRRKQWDEAEAVFGTLLSMTRDMSFPHAEGLTLHHYGRMMAEKGNSERALQLLTNAHSIFHRLGARKDLERTDTILSSLDNREEAS